MRVVVASAVVGVATAAAADKLPFCGLIGRELRCQTARHTSVARRFALLRRRVELVWPAATETEACRFVSPHRHRRYPRLSARTPSLSWIRLTTPNHVNLLHESGS